MEGFAEFLFPDALAFDCTFTPRGGLSFQTRAVSVLSGYAEGAEAGKGLNRAVRQRSSEFKHFRVPSADFEKAPSSLDELVDDKGATWRVINSAPSYAGTYLLICDGNSSFKGPSSGLSRL